MSEIASWLIQSLTPVFIFEGIKYVVDKNVIKEHRRLPKKYLKALDQSLLMVSERLKNEQKVEAQQLSSPFVKAKMKEVLCSPEIDKEKFLKLLLDEGIGKDIAEELINEIEKNFVKLLEEEGIKSKQAFQNIVLLRTREILAQQHKAEVTDKQILETLNRVFESNERYLKQIQKTTEETYCLVSEANEQLKNMPTKLIQQMSVINEKGSTVNVPRDCIPNFDYVIKISKPRGFPEINGSGTRCFNRLQNWLKSPYREGSRLQEYNEKRGRNRFVASEYLISGEVIPWNYNLRIEISILTDRWYWQGKYPVDASGQFEGVLYMHANLKSAIFRFDILKEETVMASFNVEIK